MPAPALHTPLIWRRPATRIQWDAELTELNHVTTVFHPLTDMKRRLLITLFASLLLAGIVGGAAAAAWATLALFSLCSLIGLGLRNRRARFDGPRLRLTRLQVATVTEETVHAFAHSPLLWNELAALQKAAVPLLQGDLENLMDRLAHDPDEEARTHYQSLPGAREESRHLWRSVSLTTAGLVLAATVVMAVFHLGRFH